MCSKFKLPLRICVYSLILKKAKYHLVSLVATIWEETQYSNNPFQPFFFFSFPFVFLSPDSLPASGETAVASGGIVGRNRGSRIKHFSDCGKLEIIVLQFPITAIA